MSETKPRFSFEITEEQSKRVFKIFSEYGQRKAIMGRILDEIMDMVEEHGYMVFGFILDSGVEVRKIVPALAKAERMVEK